VKLPSGHPASNQKRGPKLVIPVNLSSPVSIALCLWVAAVLSGCVSSESGLAQKKQGSYSLTSHDIVWVNRAVQETKTVQLWVDPLGVRLAGGAVHQAFNSVSFTMAAEGFAIAMATLVKPAYPFVSDAAPDTVHITARITDIISVERLAKRGDHIGADAQGRLPTLGLEIEFRDAVNNELLAAIVSLRLAPRILSLAARRSTAGNYAEAFGPMAARIRSGLDRAGPWGLAR
jgi:hypothetical protein